MSDARGDFIPMTHAGNVEGGAPDAGALMFSLRLLGCLARSEEGAPCQCTDDFIQLHIDRTGLRRNGTSSQSLLERARDCVENNAGDEAFSVERLALAMHMSRASLHRKLVARLGLAPGDFIRQVRLDMARKMLNECEDSVSSVAYAVGFETLSGFSRAFSAHFGVAPSRCRGQLD